MSTTKTKVPSLSEFYDLLEKHDWYHELVDCGDRDRAGRANLAKLQYIVWESRDDRYSELFRNFHRYYFSGIAWNTERIPKPARPVDPARIA
jgi:hypothetical protein